ncbi:PLP-dependent aminotransferase family protein [Pseudomonas asiatica]|uniref:PLP-dependent aminotransferase family protein n=1 Tax=Pseudomonas asiatica TaxID=2219225 RepID=UPI0037C6043A
MTLSDESSAPPVFAWTRPFVPGGGAKYIQILEMLEKSIQSGSLQQGDQLPPQRILAAHLGVDLTTITRAYTEARNRGLIASYSGRGSFVMGASETDMAQSIDLAMNIPPQPADGSMAQQASSAMTELLSRDSIEALSVYQQQPVPLALLKAAQGWLRPALGEIDCGGLVVCSGSQVAIFAILSAQTRPGDVVLCDALTYPGLILAAEQLKLRLWPVPSCAQGMQPDALAQACEESGARLLYLNPTFHNPTAHTMPLARRREIAEIILRCGITLIEDDPYRYLLDDAPPPIATLTGRRNTYYLASLSKCLWPSLRTSFVLPPHGDDGQSLQLSLRATSMGCSALLLALVEQWISSGAAARLMQEIKREIRARQQLASKLLSHPFQSHPTGLHLWLQLPSHWNQELFTHALRDQGVQVASGHSFAVATLAPDCLRISLGGASNQAELSRALRKIETLLNQDRRRDSRTFV